MLPSVLPITPFVIPIKKRWEDGQEKKLRTLVIDPDQYFEDTFSQSLSPGSESDSSESSYSSSDSEIEDEVDDDEEEYNFLDSYADYVTQTLLPAEAVVGQPMPKLSSLTPTTTGGDTKPGIIDRAWIRFNEWRLAERERRKHYIYKHYEERIKAHEARKAADLSVEIEKMRKDVLKEMVLLNRIRKINAQTRPKSKFEATRIATDRYHKLVAVRNTERERMDFFCMNLQRWAVEKHDEKVRVEEWKEVERKEREQKEAERERLARREKSKADDALLLLDDVRVTQEWMEMGRRVGVLAGVNVPVQVVKADDKVGFKRAKKDVKLRIGLKEGFDSKLLFRRMIDDGEDSKPKSKTPYTPFDTDLSKTAHVLELKCVNIGERGALSLSAELLRGATPSLQTLDLCNCQIQTRGMGRLLHGIKLSNLLSLRFLLLRGNGIGPRGVEYLLQTLSSGGMADLSVLDFRENEIGDDGADTFMRIILLGLLKNITQLHLQRNGIGDVGFGKLVRVLQSVAAVKVPGLERLGFEGNHVTAKSKREFAPLAGYWSV